MLGRSCRGLTFTGAPPRELRSGPPPQPGREELDLGLGLSLIKKRGCETPRRSRRFRVTSDPLLVVAAARKWATPRARDSIRMDPGAGCYTDATSTRSLNDSDCYRSRRPRTGPRTLPDARAARDRAPRAKDARSGPLFRGRSRGAAEVDRASR